MDEAEFVGMVTDRMCHMNDRCVSLAVIPEIVLGVQMGGKHHGQPRVIAPGFTPDQVLRVLAVITAIAAQELLPDRAGSVAEVMRN